MKLFGLTYWGYFILFFIVFYFENGIRFGGLSLAIIWKIPLLIYLFFFMIKNSRVPQPTFVKVNTLFSFKSFVNPYLFANPGNALDSFSRSIVQSLFYVFLWCKYKGRELQLDRIMYILSQYIILASIPALLGIVEPFIEDIDTTRYGIDNLEYFSGIFGTYHTASAYYAMTMVIFFYRIASKKDYVGREKLWDYIFVGLSLYMLFLTYVRTGWMMALVGVLFVVKPKKMTFGKVFKYAIMLILLSIGLVLFYLNSELFRARISNRNVHFSTEQKIDTSGSGRIKYWTNGVTLWYNSDVSEVLFGCGVDKVMENNYRSTGQRIISHSEFVDALVQQGLLGFIFLILFYLYLYKFIKKRINSKYYTLSMAMFVMLFIFSFFQGRVPFLAQILSTMVFVLLDFNSKK